MLGKRKKDKRKGDESGSDSEYTGGESSSEEGEDDSEEEFKSHGDEVVINGKNINTSKGNNKISKQKS